MKRVIGIADGALPEPEVAAGDVLVSRQGPELVDARCVDIPHAVAPSLLGLRLGTRDRMYEPPLHHRDSGADITQANREVDHVSCGLDRSAPAGEVDPVAIREADRLGAVIVVRLHQHWSTLL